MNKKQFFIAATAVFVIIQVTDFIFHNIIEAGTYETLSYIWRKDMMDKMWLMVVVAMVFSIFFVYIYIRGFNGSNFSGGLKYGIIMSFVQPFVASFSQYAIYPLPFSLVIQWYVYGVIQFIICGITVASICKDTAR